MIILGLTGSIGMGKSTAATMFRQLGVPVHDADASVHAALGAGGKAVKPVLDAFPEAAAAGGGGGIDRRRLGDAVFGDDAALKKLEAVLHPLVRKDEDAFLQACARRRAPVVVLDVPLLFEKGGWIRCDGTVVVSAPARVQAARVLSRPGMTAEKFGDILARQVPDAEKRLMADFVVETGLGRNHSLRTIRDIVKVVSHWRPRQWPRYPDRT